jgi:hypothetical protein
VRRLEDPLTDLGPVAIACLQAGLPTSRRATIQPDALAMEWRDVVSEGLAAVALRVLDECGLDENSPVRKRLASVAMLQEMRSLSADALLEHLCDLFGEASLPFVVIKGPAVARFHPQGWPRPYSDIDILVEPRHFREAMKLLLDSHFAYPASSLPPWQWFDIYCREGLNLHGSGNVDLHHHLAPWIFGAGLETRDIVARADHLHVGRRSVMMASREHAAVIATLHILNDLWKDQRGLASWRDLLVLLRQSEEDSLRSTFDDCKLDWLLDLALSALGRHLPDLLSNGDRDTPRIPLRFSWRLKGLGWDRSTFVSRHRLAWGIRLPLPHAVAFTVGSVVPSPRYIHARHGSYHEYWGRAWKETLSTVAGGDHRGDKVTGIPTPLR